MMLDRTVWRRLLGVVSLVAAVAMVIGGETVLKERLSPMGFLVLWLGCLACTVAAIVVAFRDFRAVTRRVARDQRELFATTLRKIEMDARSKKADQSGSKSRRGDENPRK